MKSPIVKRSVTIAGRKTSVSLEAAFWMSMKDIAAARGASLTDLVGELAERRGRGNLSSTIRTFVLEHYRREVQPTSA